MGSNTKISIQVDLPQVKDRAVMLIHQLTGENVQKLMKTSLDKLINHLSYLMQCAEESVEQLLAEHDQNKELDPQTIANLWKLVSKGVVKRKKHSLGTLPEEQYNQIKFIMSQLGDLARFRTENGLGSQRQVTADPSMYKNSPVITNSNSFSNSHQANLSTKSAMNSIPQKN